jgi:hypothetical protein
VIGRVARLGLALALAGCAGTTGGAPDAPSGGVLDLSWSAPATNVDGSASTDVVSYRVYYGTTAGRCPGGTFLTIPAPPGSPGQTVSTKLTGLKVGELYYVAVSAVSQSGRESACTTWASARARSPK